MFISLDFCLCRKYLWFDQTLVLPTTPIVTMGENRSLAQLSKPFIKESPGWPCCFIPHRRKPTVCTSWLYPSIMGPNFFISCSSFVIY